LSTVVEVHDHEGYFTDDVDPAQVVVELDAIKCDGFVVHQHNVAQVQVAMTFANKAVVLSGLKL